MAHQRTDNLFNRSTGALDYGTILTQFMISECLPITLRILRHNYEMIHHVDVFIFAK